MAALAAEQRTLADCAAVDDDARRLACYDELAGRKPPESAPRVAAQPEPPKRAAEPAMAPEGTAPELSWLSRHWELDPASKQGTFQLRLHRANYILLGKYSNNPNQEPESPTLGTAPNQQLQDVEAEFQLSFKLKLAQQVFHRDVDLWFGYTQDSFWQVYNQATSRPFRETNFQPELIAVFPTDYNFLGMRGRLINLGLVHQSNGKSDPLSRSWNRVYAQFGFERGNFVLLVRPWYRLPEGLADDDNPDIEDYLGYGDIGGMYRKNGYAVSFLLRNNLQGENNRGALQLDYSFPLVGPLKGLVQIFTGYGESLIDYNHHQTTVGLGLLLTD